MLEVTACVYRPNLTLFLCSHLCMCCFACLVARRSPPAAAAAHVVHVRRPHLVSSPRPSTRSPLCSAFSASLLFYCFHCCSCFIVRILVFVYSYSCAALHLMSSPPTTDMSEEQRLLARVDEDEEEQRSRTNTSSSQRTEVEVEMGSSFWTAPGGADGASSGFASPMRLGAQALVQAFGARASLAGWTEGQSQSQSQGQGQGKGQDQCQDAHDHRDLQDGLDFELKIASLSSVNADPFHSYRPRCSRTFKALSLADPRRIDDMLHLGELCIELLQQNEEHYSEVSGFLFKLWLVYLNFILNFYVYS